MSDTIRVGVLGAKGRVGSAVCRGIQEAPGLERRRSVRAAGYSTVTLLARLRGWSTSFPRISATW